MSKFIILSNGRSGSNFLVDVVNQHPNLCNYGEVLGHWSYKRKLKKFLRIKTEVKYLEFILSSKSFFYFSSFFYFLKDRSSFKFKKLSQIQKVGIKELGINFDKYNLDGWLQDRSDIKVINLYRENQLDRYISLLAMQHSGLVSTKTEGQAQKINVNCTDLLEFLELYETEMEYQISLASSIDPQRLYSISYEELFYGNEKKQILDKMFEFLGVNPIPITNRHLKILPNLLNEKVINFEEVFTTLKGSKFEKYLVEKR